MKRLLLLGTLATLLAGCVAVPVADYDRRGYYRDGYYHRYSSGYGYYGPRYYTYDGPRYYAYDNNWNRYGSRNGGSY
jgi:hypothetical protein